MSSLPGICSIVFIRCNDIAREFFISSSEKVLFLPPGKGFTTLPAFPYTAELEASEELTAAGRVYDIRLDHVQSGLALSLTEEYVIVLQTLDGQLLMIGSKYAGCRFMNNYNLSTTANRSQISILAPAGLDIVQLTAINELPAIYNYRVQRIQLKKNWIDILLPDRYITLFAAGGLESISVAAGLYVLFAISQSEILDLSTYNDTTDELTTTRAALLNYIDTHIDVNPGPLEFSYERLPTGIRITYLLDEPFAGLEVRASVHGLLEPGLIENMFKLESWGPVYPDHLVDTYSATAALYDSAELAFEVFQNGNWVDKTEDVVFSGDPLYGTWQLLNTTDIVEQYRIKDGSTILKSGPVEVF